MTPVTLSGGATLDLSNAVSDMGAVFGAVLAVVVIIYGYRKIRGTLR